MKLAYVTSYFRSHFGSRIVSTIFATLRRTAGFPSSMPPKGHVKDCSSLGSVVQHRDKWRVYLRLGGEKFCGPARASAEEAAADLTRARALPRQQIPAFFNGLRDQLPVESTSSSSTAPVPANQRSPTDPSSGKRPVSDELATSPDIKKPRGDDVCVTPSGP